MRRLLLPALLSAGCVSFPDETKIEDLRILEVRLTPPEIPVFARGQSARTLEELATLTPTNAAVRAEVLVAHPDLEATFTWDWGRCAPGFDDFPCENGPRVRLAESSTSGVRLEPVAILVAEALAAGDPRQALSSLARDPRQLLNGLYAEITVRAGVQAATVQVDTPAVDARKRLVIFDPSLVRVAIAQARRLAAGGQVPMIEGLDLPNLCTTVSDQRLASIERFLSERQPNRPPRYTALEMARRAADGAEQPFVPLAVGEVVELEAGEELALRGRARDEDLESYTIIDDNCELQALNETMAWSWFTTRGELSRGLTSRNTSSVDPDAERVVYTAPPASELEAERTRARVYSVLRDGRGGSEARVLELVIRR